MAYAVSHFTGDDTHLILANAPGRTGEVSSAVPQARAQTGETDFGQATVKQRIVVLRDAAQLLSSALLRTGKVTFAASAE